MPHSFGRREFLGGLAALALRSGAPAQSPALFEEVPAARSGIRWTHDNAKSPMRHLPETLGPGVAFVDYDNDGWMHIFLVNRGVCDFYRPARKPRNGLYRNNREGTFTDVTAAASVRDGIGARVTWRVDGVTRSKLKTAGGSYLSAHDPREILGLGRAGKVAWVEVRWPAPSVRTERYSALPADRYSILVEGERTPVTAP